MPFNFNECVAQYIAEAAGDGNYPREKSWDYVWDYFQPFVTTREWRRFLVRAERLELTALHIGFYLASCGMFRARGKLYRQNLDFFMKLSQHLMNVDSAFWALQFGQFRNDTQAVVLFNQVRSGLTNFLQKELGQQNVNLIVGKLLLGTWGSALQLTATSPGVLVITQTKMRTMLCSTASY